MEICIKNGVSTPLDKELSSDVLAPRKSTHEISLAILIYGTYIIAITKKDKTLELITGEISLCLTSHNIIQFTSLNPLKVNWIS